MHQGRSNGHANSKSAFVPVRQLLQRNAVSQGDEVVIEALVKGVEGGDGRPVVVLLADDTTENQPVGMYLQSQLLSLCMGPAPLLRGNLSNLLAHIGLD